MGFTDLGFRVCKAFFEGFLALRLIVFVLGFHKV